MASRRRVHKIKLNSLLRTIKKGKIFALMFGLVFLSMGTLKKISDKITRTHLDNYDGKYLNEYSTLHGCDYVTDYEDKKAFEEGDCACECIEQHKPTDLAQECLARLPDHFDARVHWPACAHIIDHISNQGDCGSCWAVAIADVISDRLCIASRGNNRTRLSARDLMDVADGGGCNGEYLADMLGYFINCGLVTEQCKPYPSEVSLQFSYKFSTKIKQIFPPSYFWEELCSNPRVDYMSDIYYGKSFCILSNNEFEIMEEIYRNGPVLASLILEDEFLENWDNSQVYSCKSTEELEANHAVRIIGWGVEQHRGQLLPFWLVANSWGRDFGQDGTFKVARGNQASCLIEDEVYAVYL